MTCCEVREYLFAFLDNELDAPLSIELQRHLERCCDCAREAEIERAIRKQLERVFEQEASALPAFDGSTAPALREAGPIAPEADRRFLRFSGRRRWYRAAAAIVLLATGGTAWYLGTGSPGSEGAPSLPELLVRDFEHFLAEGKPVQLASADRVSVARWLQERTDLAVDLPPARSRGIELIGARKCQLNDRPAAFAVYDVQGTPASLVIVAAGERALAGMERVGAGGRTHWVDRRAGHTVLACRRGPVVYAAVSTLPENKLLVLLEHARDESE